MRVSAHVFAATAAASFVLLLVSAMPAYAFASPNPNPNPDNNGHHYGWYKHPPTPPPLPTPQPTSQPTPQSHPGTSTTGSTHSNQDPPAPQSLGTLVTPAAIVLQGEHTVYVFESKADDLALWVIYVLLAGLALLWIGLVAAATVRSMTGRPAPKRA
ncbi:MAG TPA: hypothetical protein VFR33_10790 [Candidatus Dormibacteraeota bacterium]|nr:hypothetical protein [Candidatus Dormibacteraeota bacterium]